MLPHLRSFIRNLPPGRLTRDDLVTEETLLAEEGQLSVHFIPFGYFPAKARLALVGITPGFKQMQLAYEAARDYRWKSDEDLFRHCGAQAGFGGPMRKILVEMLDGIGIADAMGMSTCDDLFDPQREDVIRTSALRHPVFFAGQNYTGHRPKPTHPFLMDFAEEYFAASMSSFPDVLVVPMGKAVELLIKELGLPNPVLWGFPHPSPANAHRKKVFAKNRNRLRRIVRTAM